MHILNRCKSSLCYIELYDSINDEEWFNDNMNNIKDMIYYSIQNYFNESY